MAGLTGASPRRDGTFPRHRLHLDEARITKGQWRALWDAARWWIIANGESGKRFRNETIRVGPKGVLEVDLPQTLAQLANVTRGGLTRYSVIRIPRRGSALGVGEGWVREDNPL